MHQFIDYYAYYTRKWPELFEFIICDWNPPSDKPRLEEAYPWEQLGRVTHVVVPPEVHATLAGDRGRKILDYVGRNVSARRAIGKFILVLNQDIFVSESILSLLAQRKLSQRYFYRADRCDFHLPTCIGLPAQEFEKAATEQVFAIHRRHSSADLPISVDATPKRLVELGSRLESGDRFDYETGIIFCASDLPLHVRSYKQKLVEKHECLRRLHLHTNASGDFLLVPRAAFFAIHGMPETTEFYMHLDSYAVVQLFCAGLKQAIFLQPHRVLHADHDRSDRSDFLETLSWSEHERRLTEMILRERTFRLNPRDWGLAQFRLPTKKISRIV
jgi:hypothetical protein